MSELTPTVLVWLDGDDDAAEQTVNLRAALDQMKFDGLIKSYLIVTADA